MTIKYKKIKQLVKGADGTSREIHYARACNRQRVKLDEVADHIADYTSLSRGEVHAVLMALTDSIPRYLLDNQTVELGDLGTLSLHFTSQSEERAEAVSWRSIKDLKVQFRAGLRLKKRLKHASYELVKEAVEKEAP